MATIADVRHSEGSAADRAPWPTRTAVVGLALALLLGATPFTHWLVPGDGLASQVMREGAWWLGAAALLLWLVRVEGRSLASVGIRWTGWRGMTIGIVAGLLLIAIQVLHFTVVAPALGVDPAAAMARRTSILALPFSFRVASPRTIGFPAMCTEPGAFVGTATPCCLLGVPLTIGVMFAGVRARDRRTGDMPRSLLIEWYRWVGRRWTTSTARQRFRPAPVDTDLPTCTTINQLR